MIYEIFKLSDNNECDYESYALTMTVGALISQSHSSNIQRMRNEKKENGIINFIEKSIDSRKTPFFQPFILHYNGDTVCKDGKYILDANPQFLAKIEGDNGLEDRLFEFEVIDGNGRLNSMIRLSQKYINSILAETEAFNCETDLKKKKKIENKIYDLKSKNKTLKDTKLVIQLYLNLTDEQKAQLFNSVNQGEKMSEGRLKVYNGDKIENQLLAGYISHTESIDFPYIITPDKDTLRTEAEREKYIPAVFVLPAIRKLLKYCRIKTMENIEDFIFQSLDLYITESHNPPHLRKHFFSIFGTIVDEAAHHDGELESYILNMIEFDYTKYEDVSKQLKLIRQDITKYVFGGTVEKAI